MSYGWYIDNVEIITGPIIFNNPENFELGIGDWISERGTWEVGEPTAGPDSAHSPPFCAATVLAGNYSESVSSRIISPPFKVPKGEAGILFWHWYSFSNYDYGVVQIKLKNDEWKTISDSEFINTSSNKWTPYYIPLSTYADSTVQIAFYFYSQQSGSYASVSKGWYIDDVKIEGGNQSPTIKSLIANPSTGQPPITVTLNCQAGDNDGSVTEYRWDFDSDNSVDTTTTDSLATYTYNDCGDYEATCTVIDNNGASSQPKSVFIYVTCSDTLHVVLPDTTALFGETVQIPIRITNATRVAGAEFKVTYDANILEAKSVSNTTLTNGFNVEDSLTTGKIAIVMAASEGLEAGSGDFVLLTFDVIGNGGDISPLTFELAKLYDANTDTIAVTRQNGSLEVMIADEPEIVDIYISPLSDTLLLNETQDFLSFGNFSNGTIEAISATWSLVNNFGSIGNISPAAGVQTTFTATGTGDGYIVANYETFVDSSLIVVGSIKGDINNDGKVNVQDCIRCLQYLVGSYSITSKVFVFCAKVFLTRID
ncbi:choice-of-anchor J domain-containing protein [candidate division KSB1 bacterium]|nr:choice-of-anchor J domain-containing protein [candidate division KSB1 bacterium]